MSQRSNRAPQAEQTPASRRPESSGASGAACLGRAPDVLRSFVRAHAACGPVAVAALQNERGILYVVEMRIQLQQARDLMRQALTPEMLEALRKLDNASQQLAGEQARQSLAELAEQQ